MSPQVEFLKNLVVSAELGHENAIAMLRRIIVRAAEQAPAHDLVALGALLVNIGVEATNTEISRN